MAGIPERGFVDAKQVEAWLTARPERERVAFSRAIALRAALRALPLAGRVWSAGYKDPEIAPRLIGAFFRASAISRVAAIIPTSEIVGAAYEAAAAAARADAYDITADGADAVARVAYAAAAYDVTADGVDTYDAAAAAARAAAAYAGTAYAAAARAAAAANAAADAAFAAAAIWAAVTADARALEGGVSPAELADRPLWPGEAPDWWENERARLEKALATAPSSDPAKYPQTHWPIWSEWYRSRVFGTPSFGLPRDIADELDRRVALGDGREDFWDRSPEAINGEIAGWVAEARLGAKLTPPAQGSGLQFEVRNKLIELSHKLGLAGPNDDIDRIRKQLPILLQLVEKLEGQLCDGEMPRDSLLESLRELGASIRQGMERGIDATELFTRTLIFRGQLHEAQHPQPGVNVYPFTGGDLATAKSIATISDMIVLATEAGRDLFDAADRAETDAGELERYRKLELELLDIIAADGAIMEKATVALLKQVILLGNRGPLPARAAFLSAGSTRNALVVITGFGVVSGIVLGAVPLSTLAVGGIVAGFIVKTLFGQSIKDSVVGRTFNKEIVKLMDRHAYDFVYQHREKLKQVAGDRPSYRWLKDLVEAAEKNAADLPEKPKGVQLEGVKATGTIEVKNPDSSKDR